MTPDELIARVRELKKRRDEVVILSQYSASVALLANLAPLLADAMEQALRAQEWQPIETAPKTTKSILVWCAERKNTYIVFWRDGRWNHFGGCDEQLHEEPTLWQPRPKPPTT